MFRVKRVHVAFTEYVRQINIYIYEKSQLNRLVWGSLTLAPNSQTYFTTSDKLSYTVQTNGQNINSKLKKHIPVRGTFLLFANCITTKYGNTFAYFPVMNSTITGHFKLLEGQSVSHLCNKYLYSNAV